MSYFKNHCKEHGVNDCRACEGAKLIAQQINAHLDRKDPKPASTEGKLCPNCHKAGYCICRKPAEPKPQEPREWYLYKPLGWDRYWANELLSTYPSDSILVIEKSAYDDVVMERDELRAEVEAEKWRADNNFEKCQSYKEEIAALREGYKWSKTKMDSIELTLNSLDRANKIRDEREKK